MNCILCNSIIESIYFDKNWQVLLCKQCHYVKAVYDTHWEESFKLVFELSVLTIRNYFNVVNERKRGIRENYVVIYENDKPLWKIEGINIAPGSTIDDVDAAVFGHSLIKLDNFGDPL